MLTYFVSYLTRINYGAIISEMESATSWSRSMLSMAVTGSFITYGAGQVVSGICGDHISPKKLISYGLTATVLMNILIPLCQDPVQMLFVWCLNGFAQAFMWPPLVKAMTVLFSEEDYKKATVKVSWGSSFGTMAVYLFSPLLITFFGWKSVFWFSAACGLVMLFVWKGCCLDVGVVKKESDAADTAKNMKVLFQPLMIGIMLAIILQGMLRDGVTTWMPSFISETYDISNRIGILTGVILPVFSILSLQAASVLHRKKLKNPLLCSGLIFGIGVLASLGLILLNGKNAVLSVFFSAVLTGCMHGVNIVLVCMLPVFFKRYGNVSTVSGVLNACTYVGSAISSYGIAVLSEQFGWTFTLKIWLLIAFSGTILCLLGVKPWNRQMTE